MIQRRRPTPTEGTAGSTDATHTGELRFNGEYTPDASGMAAVWADTPMEAVTTALYGTFTATLNDETVEYPFNADTVGTPADQKAFTVVISGTSVSVALEDLAGFPDVISDWDYNDRTWGGVTVGSMADPVVDSGSWTWTAPKTGETVTVAMRVTMESPDEFFWKYDVTNNNLSMWYPQSPGMSHFLLGGAEVDASAASAASAVATTMAGWAAWASDGTLGAGVTGDGGPSLAMGYTASLTFRTPPVPVVPATESAGLAPWPVAGGDEGGWSVIPAGTTP